jgi:NAD(P)-dependent dehydrogenase (short-subunit alcohol dehydrogenase family)
MHSIDLSGQVALVTGAARGIGRAIASALAGAGADLALADLHGDALRRTAAALAAATGRRVHALEVDVRDAAAVRAMVEASAGALGRLDVLVNNAGGTFEAPFLQVNERGFRAMLDLNLGSVWHGTQAAAAWWIANRAAGRVVNVASTEALKACPGYAAYSAAKAGVVNLTKTLAVELGPHGIRVNAIAPDYTRLEAPVGVEAPDEAAIAARIPLGRYGEPADHAGAVLFFASELSAWITGQTLVVDGGALVAARVEGALPVKPQDAKTR